MTGTIKTDHATLLNALNDMHSNPAYALRRSTLREAESLIIRQEHQIKKLEQALSQVQNAATDLAKESDASFEVTLNIGQSRKDLRDQPITEGEKASGLSTHPVVGLLLDVAVPEGLIDLLRSIRPKFGAVGSRDVDVAAQQKSIDAAIAMLAAAPAPQGARPTAGVLDRAELEQHMHDWAKAEGWDAKGKAMQAVVDLVEKGFK